MNVLDTPYPELGARNDNSDGREVSKKSSEDSALGLDDICLEEEDEIDSNGCNSARNQGQIEKIEINIPTDQCSSLGIDVVPEKNCGLVIDKVSPDSIMRRVCDNKSGKMISVDISILGGLITRVNGETENKNMIETVRCAFSKDPPGPVSLTICSRPQPFNFVVMPLADTSGITLGPDTTTIVSISRASATDLSNAGRWPKIRKGDIISGIGDAVTREQIVEKLKSFGSLNMYVEITPRVKVKSPT